MPENDQISADVAAPTLFFLPLFSNFTRSSTSFRAHFFPSLLKLSPRYSLKNRIRSVREKISFPPLSSEARSTKKFSINHRLPPLGLSIHHTLAVPSCQFTRMFLTHRSR